MFSILKPILRCVVWVVRRFPSPVRRFLFVLVGGVPFNFGVFLRYVIGCTIFQKMGDNVYIAPYVTIKNPENLEVGNNVSIHQNVYIDALGGVRLGNNVSIAHQSSLISFDHTWNDQNQPIKYNELNIRPICIEDDVWVACGVRILAGVHLEKRTVVAAGAVVTGKKRFVQNVVIGGIPARVVKYL